MNKYQRNFLSQRRLQYFLFSIHSRFVKKNTIWQKIWHLRDFLARFLNLSFALFWFVSVFVSMSMSMSMCVYMFVVTLMSSKAFVLFFYWCDFIVTIEHFLEGKNTSWWPSTTLNIYWWPSIVSNHINHVSFLIFQVFF